MIRAKYTVVLKELLDNKQTKELIHTALQEYPIYKPENEFLYTLIPTREELNKKILDNYKYKEIGFETVGRFIDELRIAMNEIMPYYNQEYKAFDILNGVEDPFGNVDIVETYEEQTEGKSIGKSNTTSNTNAESNSNSKMVNNNKEVHSTTPQTEITINEIDDVKHADEIKWNKDISTSEGKNTDKANSTNSGTSEGTSEGKTSHTLTKKGNQGVNTYAHDLKELRSMFTNIEQRIINDKRISELFMLIY